MEIPVEGDLTTLRPYSSEIREYAYLKERIRRGAFPNADPPREWDNLHTVVRRAMEKMAGHEMLVMSFFSKMLRRFCILAVEHDLRSLCSKIAENPTQDTKVFEKSEIMCIMANAFFCTVPFTDPESNINLDSLYDSESALCKNREDKLMSLLMYLLNCVMMESDPKPRIRPPLINEACKSGSVEFRKHQAAKPPSPLEDALLADLSIHSDEVTSGSAPLILECSNIQLGKNIFSNACGREERTFVTRPDLILAKLLPWKLEKNEALVVTGANTLVYNEKFLRGSSWNKNPLIQLDDSPVVIIDTHLKDEGMKPQFINTEILKAYAGFSAVECQEVFSGTSGDWGSERKKANKDEEIAKMKIQWIAASMAKRKLFYHVFEDAQLQNSLEEEKAKMSGKKISELLLELVPMAEAEAFWI